MERRMARTVRMLVAILISFSILISGYNPSSAQTTSTLLWQGQSIPSNAGINQPNYQICFNVSKSFSYSGGQIWLSSQGTTVSPIAIDDEVKIIITRPDGTQVTFDQISRTLDIGPFDFSNLLGVGNNQLNIQIIDLMGPLCGGGSLYLVYQGTGGTQPQPTTPTIDSLRTLIAQCVNNQGIATSLNAKIDSGAWNAFINEVEAQSGKHIDPQCAQQMITIAIYFLRLPPQGFDPGDGRADGRPGDRIAVYCNAPTNIVVYGTTTAGKGFYLTTFTNTDFSNTSNVTKNLGTTGTVAASQNRPSWFWITWTGGQWGATGQGDFAKSVHCQLSTSTPIIKPPNPTCQYPLASGSASAPNQDYFYLPNGISCLRLRTGAGTNYPTKGRLADGQYYVLLGLNGFWAHISTSVGDGWVDSSWGEIHYVTTPTPVPTFSPQSMTISAYKTEIHLNLIPARDPANGHLSWHMACAIFSVPQKVGAPLPVVTNAWYEPQPDYWLFSFVDNFPAGPHNVGDAVSQEFNIPTPKGYYLIARCIHTGDLAKYTLEYGVSYMMIQGFQEMGIRDNWRMTVTVYQ